MKWNFALAQNIRQHYQSREKHSLLFLDLHGEAFHVGIFKVKAEVFPAEAQVGWHVVRWQSRGLGGQMERELRGEKMTPMN